MSRPAILTLCALLSACGGLPPGAERANQLLSKGDYDAAEKEADRELARFPKHPTLWGIKVRAAMGRGDNQAAVEAYDSWREIRGHDDAGLLEVMADTVLWQALRTPSAAANAQAIQVIERLELERFARDVGERVVHDDDLVAAAASAAVLRSHPAAPRVATDLLRSENPRARAIVVASIGKKIGARARDDLLPMLRDPAPNVRRVAVVAVGQMNDPDDTERLLAIARGDDDGPVRASAISVLGDRAGAIDAAVAALDDPYLGARLAAVQLIATRGDDAARARLVELARGDDLFVALRAAANLARAGHQKLTDPVDRALAADAWSVRAAAVSAAVDLVAKPKVLELVGRRLADPRIEVRLAAARAMIQLGVDARARPIFAEALDAPSDPARLQGARGLARLRDPRGRDALSKLCKAPSPATRSAAVQAHIQLVRPTPGLVAALADESVEVRIDAAETLLLLVSD